LEGVKEYEPLFPEDEDESKPRKSKPASLHDGEGPRHHFPSKDVWEDEPESVHYETTVQTPQIPEFSRREAEHEPKEIFETTEAEQARKDNISSGEQATVSNAQSKPKQQFNKGIAADIPSRPSYRHRFPSQDQWEDTPESAMQTTTVDSEQEQNDAQTQAPAIPERPKPQIPARPAKQDGGDSESSLSRSVSREEELSFPKVKPPVPARPIGSKISALRGAFMNDLESRLKVGPQAIPSQAKEVEAEQEKTPLTDARKGRARGPARRRPGQSPGAEHSARGAPKVSFVSAVTIWEIDEEGSVSIPTDIAKKDEPKATEAKATDQITQTGQMDLKLPKNPGEEPFSKTTVFVEGRAQDGGSEMIHHDGDVTTTKVTLEKPDISAS
jgi:hypothetical protein